MAVATGTAILGAAVLGGGLSAYSSKRAGDKQAKAMGKQSDIAKAEWDRYQTAFAPLEDKAIAEAQAPVTEQPGFGNAMGSLDRSFSNNAATIGRVMGGRYQNGAGLEGSMQRSNELNRGRAKAQVFGDYAKQRSTNMLNMASLGRNIPDNVSDIYGKQAATYAKMSSASGASAGDTMGDLMTYYLLSQNKGG